MSESFCRHHALIYSGAGMLNKTPLCSVPAAKQRTTTTEEVCCIFEEDEEKKKERRKEASPLSNVYSIHLQYQTCIDTDNIMTN